MAQIIQSIKSSFKTFDYHSFTIEGRFSFDLANDKEMLKLICDKYELQMTDSDGAIDPFVVDRAVRTMAIESFLKQKAKIDKWPKENFGLPQFQGESWS